eukprot:s1069_g8.t1
MMQDICIKIAGRSHHCWTKPGGSHEGPSQESSSSTFLQKRVKWPKCLMLLPNDGLLLSGMWSSSSGPKVPPTTKILEKEVRRPLSQRQEVQCERASPEFLSQGGLGFRV